MVELLKAGLPEGTIVKKPKHRDFPTHQDENQFWGIETAIHVVYSPLSTVVK